jgi:hypothetical protein
MVRALFDRTTASGALPLVAMVPTGIPAIERKRLGEIEFFGYKSIDVVAIPIRLAVP